MNIAKRNHYNPCFWTANWNPAYYQATQSRTETKFRAREQKVHVLNLKSAKIYETAVDNVHFEKNLGKAVMTPEAMLDFCKRTHPERAEQMQREIDRDPSTLILDFEGTLTGMENSIAYDALRKILRTHRINPPYDKAALSSWIVIHHQRSHAVMNSFLEMTAEMGQEKFEHFIEFKWAFGNHKFLYKLAMTLVPFRWQLYHTQRDTFPLNDSPILTAIDKVFVPISPRLLLEIDRTKRESENSISTSNYIGPEKLEEFRLRMLANTYREIIFSSPVLLEEWRDSSAFRSRRELVNSQKSYNVRESNDGSRELWNINALANRLS